MDMAYVTLTLPGLSSSLRSGRRFVFFMLHMKKWIIYSLGNFVSPSSFSENLELLLQFIHWNLSLTRKHSGRASIKGAQKCMERHRKKRVVTLSIDLRALLMAPFSCLILFACHTVLALISSKSCDCLSPFHHTGSIASMVHLYSLPPKQRQSA